VDKFLRYEHPQLGLVTIDLDDESPPSPQFAVYLDIPFGFYTKEQVMELACKLQQAVIHTMRHQREG
jgi:hypothetical protein